MSITICKTKKDADIDDYKIERFEKGRGKEAKIYKLAR